MDYRQQRDQYGQQSGWGQQGRQQDQWRDGGEMNANYNMQQSPNQHPSYGEVYHGNLKQREEETNRARGRNFGSQSGSFEGGMFQGRSQQHRYGHDYNPGGYGQVGNTGGGYNAWDSHGSSGNDMGGNFEGHNQGWDNRYNAGGNYGQQGGSGQHMGNNARYEQRQQHSSHDDDNNNWWDRAKNEVRSWFDDDNRGDNRGRGSGYYMHEGAVSGNRRIVGGERSGNDRMGGESHSRGEHYGKGPKGYNRSEDRIREDVCERLAYDGHIDASDIEVKIEGSEVILTGTVRSRAEKRRAEDLVESVMGVRNVENRIRVDHEQQSGNRSASGMRHTSENTHIGSNTGSSYSDSSRSSEMGRYSNTGGSGTTGSNLENRSYTGNTGDQSGIGSESGTTNEIIRNSGSTDSKL